MEAWLCALAELAGVGPARLRALLSIGAPDEVWRRLEVGPLPRVDGVAAALVSQWRRQVSTVDVGRVWARYEERGTGVMAHGAAGYPEVLVDDPDPPAVLFLHGEPHAFRLPRVGIVGTRRCTNYGADVAFELGRGLAAAGVCVVSGLAVGIDAAAHAGAIDADLAPPVAVVGSGLDVVYPRQNRHLWHSVASRGAVVSEAPLGVAPEPWRFPARNRIIAGLSDIVVVVESKSSGGSMHTVNEAIERGVPVMAVPGPIRSPASAGTNRLLSEGCAPVCDVDDLLVMLGLDERAIARTDARPEPSPTGRRVLDAFCWQPVGLDTLVGRTGLPIPDIALTIERLLADRWIVRNGPWLERAAAG